MDVLRVARRQAPPDGRLGPLPVHGAGPGTLESAEADLGFAAGSDGDAFGTAPPH